MDRRILLLLPLLCLLNACVPADIYDNASTECRQMRSNIIFNGKTSNIRQAEIQNAEVPLNQSNYHWDRCERRKEF